MPAEHVPELLAVMATAGFYDESGVWMYKAGLPAKTGVGGGIVAVVPGRFAIAAFSPRLNEAGNSIRSMKAIQRHRRRARRRRVRAESELTGCDGCPMPRRPWSSSNGIPLPLRAGAAMPRPFSSLKRDRAMSFLRTSVVAALAMSATLASAQGTSTSIEERLQQLEAEQAAIKQQLAERDAVIEELKRELQSQAAAAASTRPGARPPRRAAGRGGRSRGPRRSRCRARTPTPRGETWGVYDPGDGFLVGRNEYGELVAQRLRDGALHEPARRRPGVHRPPRQRASGRHPQRHLLAPDHGVPEGLDRRSEARSTTSSCGP